MPQQDSHHHRQRLREAAQDDQQRNRPPSRRHGDVRSEAHQAEQARTRLHVIHIDRRRHVARANQLPQFPRQHAWCGLRVRSHLRRNREGPREAATGCIDHGGIGGNRRPQHGARICVQQKFPALLPDDRRLGRVHGRVSHRKSRRKEHKRDRHRGDACEVPLPIFPLAQRRGKDSHQRQNRCPVEERPEPDGETCDDTKQQPIPRDALPSIPDARVQQQQ